MTDLNQLSQQYHDALPGLVRAALVDYGVAGAVIDAALLGWDGNAITVPVRSSSGRVSFFERWNPASMGRPLEDPAHVDLFGRDTIPRGANRLVFAEGIHEALIFRSQGLFSLAATGSGRFFKPREWASVLTDASEVLVAFKSGEQVERSPHLMSRREVVGRVLEVIPLAREVVWPVEYPRDAGAQRFFVEEKRSLEDFLALPRR